MLALLSPLAHNDAMACDRPLTDFIRCAQRGDKAALALLFEATYQDLRKVARARLRRRSRDTLLDTTALVHESYLRFAGRWAGSACATLEDRRHFLCYVSRTMRSVIVDCARARLSERRGGQAVHITLGAQVENAPALGEIEILKVHEALEHLAHYGERIAQVVEMRYFAGMTESQMAEALGVTERTVRRDWEKAKVLLAEALG
jgi:RNA polymerase sigma factor (TIGR02999 family)